MIDPVPSSIELSPVQREILDLIIQDQAAIQGPVEPERAILLWSDGISESATAEKLGISEEQVRILRYRWWSSMPRLAAAEKKLHKAFNDLTHFPNPKRRTPFKNRTKCSGRRRSRKQRQPRETNRAQRITICDASAN
jgi:hypothetical protein